MQETLSAPQPGSDLATNPQGKSLVFSEVIKKRKMLSLISTQVGGNHVTSSGGMEWLPGQVYLKHEFILYLIASIMSRAVKFLLIFRLVFCSSVRCEEVGQVSSKGKRP